MAESANQSLSDDKNIVWLVYILHVLGFFTGGLTTIAAIIINYVKAGDLQSSIAKSHFKWQVRTFWCSLVWGIVSLVLVYFLVGLLGFLVLFVWYVYRLVIGMINLNNEKGMYGV